MILRGLKLSELEEGQLYKCLLSGNHVLITSIRMVHNEKILVYAISYYGQSYQPNIPVFDGQLTKLDLIE